VTEVVSAADARAVFLGAQGLLADPSRTSTPARLRRVIDALGFVQVDSINTVARAHDLVLSARLDGYSPAALDRLLERERFVFEHWTHDASVIPTAHYAHWKHRFARDRERIPTNAWWSKLLGANAGRTCRGVLERIRAEGPLRASDFEREGHASGGFWSWKPEKAALDYLWRSGDLAIRGRSGFHKIYDLAERVLPTHHALPASTADEHVTWAAESAAERLVVFTPRELAAFWNAIPIAEARSFCDAAVRDGRFLHVLVESEDGSAPQPALALADLRQRRARLPDPPPGMRMLAPFDPVLRDRARCLRRFGFDYRFEAYTPADKRVWGYYVLPLLEGDRLVGRVDPKMHRDRDVLELRAVHWERGVRPTKARRRALAEAAERLARLTGARTIDGLPLPCAWAGERGAIAAPAGDPRSPRSPSRPAARRRGNTR
jgi:hypothetical protein